MQSSLLFNALLHSLKLPQLKFSHSYRELGADFYQSISPTPVKSPNLLLWNVQLAEQLNIPLSEAQDSEEISQYFSGNQLPDHASPIAIAYAGHQFGHFNPQLGDGRAHLLGELRAKNGELFDIQLKGSGQSAFSRQGDGRCAIGPAIREFLMSEAMHALGVPTTRCLSVVATGETVVRNGQIPGAVVTRVASSHIRVGTFQYFAARQNISALEKLAKYTIARHFPTIDTSQNDYLLQFVEQVMNKQIHLVVNWLRVGFIHGVMNTDNTAISGETIDFGPCAMMGAYDPQTVFSSIDKQGRYAFANQANMAQWNYFRFVETLLPLIDEDEDEAIAKLQPIVEQFSPKFSQAYDDMMAKKIGYQASNHETKALVKDLLTIMSQHRLDYTETFHQLTRLLACQHQESRSKEITDQLCDSLRDWSGRWLEHITTSKYKVNDCLAIMQSVNPVVIPRNHHIEALLATSELTENCQHLADFLAVIRSPYQQIPQTAQFVDIANGYDENYQTFCGT